MTTWGVRKYKHEIKLDYELREGHREIMLKHYRDVIANISKKTGHTFTCTGDAYQMTGYPFLNLDCLIDTQKSTMKWSIGDDQQKTRFVLALYELGNQLRGCGVLDGDEIDTNKIARGLIRNKNFVPLLVTGNGNYRVILEEDTTTPINVLDEIKAAVNYEIDEAKKNFDTIIAGERLQMADEIARLKAESKDLYHLKMPDVVGGWFTYLQDDHVRLGKTFTYEPTHYNHRGKTYVIKETTRKKYRIDGFIIYDKIDGHIRVRTKSEAMRTPHTQTADGALCLGSLTNRPKLELSDAKTFITRTETMLTVINRDSLAANRWGELDVYDNEAFIEKHTTYYAEEEHVIDPLAEGAII
jgi:hypothetical protein